MSDVRVSFLSTLDRWMIKTNRILPTS